MANLTLSIDDDLLRRARIRALEQGSSVNAVVREFLGAYAQAGRQQESLRNVLSVAERANAGTAQEGRTWRRDELYEERTAWPHS